jgi:hypothetical protein
VTTTAGQRGDHRPDGADDAPHEHVVPDFFESYAK